MSTELLSAAIEEKSSGTTANRISSPETNQQTPGAARMTTVPARQVIPPKNTRSHELNTLLGGTIRLELKQPRMVRSVAFLSNKGGVGKTHISTNMSFYIRRLGKEALLIDLDLGNSDVTNKLGFYCENTINDLLAGRHTYNQLVYTTPFGFDLIAGESGNLRLANLHASQKKRFIRLLGEMGNDYDFVLYDLGAGITATTLDFALAQDHQIIVTTPQDIVAGYSCVKAAFERFQEVETRLYETDATYRGSKTFRPFVIMNQVPTFATGKDLFEKMKTVIDRNVTAQKGFSLDVNLLGVIAADQEHIREAELNRFLYSAKYGATHTGQCFHFLAHNLIQYRDPNKMEFTSKLKRFASLFMKSVEEVKYAQ